VGWWGVLLEERRDEWMRAEVCNIFQSVVFSFPGVREWGRNAERMAMVTGLWFLERLQAVPKE
jgi:hypothetical protein